MMAERMIATVDYIDEQGRDWSHTRRLKEACDLIAIYQADLKRAHARIDAAEKLADQCSRFLVGAPSEASEQWEDIGRKIGETLRAFHDTRS